MKTMRETLDVVTSLREFFLRDLWVSVVHFIFLIWFRLLRVRYKKNQDRRKWNLSYLLLVKLKRFN